MIHTKNQRERTHPTAKAEQEYTCNIPSMPTSSSYRRERPRQQRRRSSSWSHSYRRKSQASRSSYYSEDDDDDDNSAYLSASSASEEERSVSSASEESEDEHDREKEEQRRRRHKRGQRPDRNYRDDDRRDRHHGGSIRRNIAEGAESTSLSRHHRDRGSHRDHKKTPRDRERETTTTKTASGINEDGYGEDPAATIARLEHQLAEALATNAKLEDKAAKQDKAIKFRKFYCCCTNWDILIGLECYASLLLLLT